MIYFLDETDGGAPGWGREVLRYCLASSTSFTLTRSRFAGRGAPRDSERLLSPFYKFRFFTYDWIFYDVPWNSEPLCVSVFRSTPEAARIVLENTDDIFAPFGRISDGQTLEDLCFFRGRQPFFGTVSHEGIAAILADDRRTREDIFRVVPRKFWFRREIDGGIPERWFLPEKRRK